MGCFGYICKGCKTSIRGNCFTGGEKTIIIHVRHGEEKGRVEGHYDEYGRVIEQEGLPEVEKFRGDSGSINGHSEICLSECRLEDSYDKVIEKRVFNNKDYDFYFYVGKLIIEEQMKHEDDIRKSDLYKYVNPENKEFIEDYISKTGDMRNRRLSIEFSIGLEELKYNRYSEIYKQFLELPQATRKSYSGIVAWHSACYNKATEKERADLTPSAMDPNQSWGKVRKKYS